MCPIQRSYLFLDDEAIYMGDEDSFVVTDAKPVTKYSFRLRYTTEGDESPFSVPVQVETPESGSHPPSFILGSSIILGHTAFKKFISHCSAM